MRARADLRGQPLLVLIVVLGGWITARAVLWETPFAQAVRELPSTLLASSNPVARLAIEPIQAYAADAFARSTPAVPAREIPQAAPLPVIPLADPILPPPAIRLPDPLRPKLEPFEPAPESQRLSAAHNMLMLAGLSSITLPPELASLLVKPEPRSAPYQTLSTTVASPSGGRWSADGWFLLREDDTTALTSGRGSYGGSQAGAVVRYSLAPSSAYRPMVYLRASQSLGRAKDTEAALGLSARPIPRVPVRAAAEVRLTQASGQTLVRPAAYAVTELPPFELPLGFTAEAYGQAGYVGGKYASAFVDGQLRAERKLAEFGDTKLTAGGGAWGGAQKGAARLDLGPSASLKLKLGDTNSRVSMDWRFRVAGDAQPASGPALTISAGF